MIKRRMERRYKNQKGFGGIILAFAGETEEKS
jgi:hypothetical protein